MLGEWHYQTGPARKLLSDHPHCVRGQAAAAQPGPPALLGERYTLTLRTEMLRCRSLLRPVCGGTGWVMARTSQLPAAHGLWQRLQRPNLPPKVRSTGCAAFLLGLLLLLLPPVAPLVLPEPTWGWAPLPAAP